ncbi:precorrin-2 dehydrogenase/sirohydrochlorin ferrochelatase family protein [Pelotalea chapellei]|uniref:precorrin-2 dehydrogenase n=1 Tax=Pelotalea chapellei TaxID=44671 RepID=A0ABS5U552_9BACT|nr:bifunctional precorrin-2 dehydrogenase/sirohydrochlorin ferrochelatase [Pelotalea chapellei]MBT1070800.1 bifunctional precorrin-2 dehydrogenase/sirohydrochlorin ferrochelatase [Pelotalea chapellei]
MPYLPLNIDAEQRQILVAGGGVVAARKVRVLLETGARVHVVAPELVTDLKVLVAAESITRRIGSYERSDLKGHFLVVAATNDVEVNRDIAADARAEGILVAVADDPRIGDCLFPAILRRGKLEISISTAGTSPAFAVEVRNLIAGMIDVGYGLALDQLAAEREKLLTEGNGSTYNKKIMRSRARELIKQLAERKDRVL